jgi:hypothetical protein
MMFLDDTKAAEYFPAKSGYELTPEYASNGSIAGNSISVTKQNQQPDNYATVDQALKGNKDLTTAASNTYDMTPQQQYGAKEDSSVTGTESESQSESESSVSSSEASSSDSN